jgi:hypothetical protein
LRNKRSEGALLSKVISIAIDSETEEILKKQEKSFNLSEWIRDIIKNNMSDEYVLKRNIEELREELNKKEKNLAAVIKNKEEEYQKKKSILDNKLALKFVTDTAIILKRTHGTDEFYTYKEERRQGFNFRFKQNLSAEEWKKMLDETKINENFESF